MLQGKVGRQSAICAVSVIEVPRSICGASLLHVHMTESVESYLGASAGYATGSCVQRHCHLLLHGVSFLPSTIKDHIDAGRTLDVYGTLCGYAAL